MRKNGTRYETNFFIVSADAQEKIYAHLRGVTPELTKSLTQALEYKTACLNERYPDWHEGYQPYEDMKWALLMLQVDKTERLDRANQDQSIPAAGLGKLGHTIRLMVESGICWGWRTIPVCVRV